MDESKQHNDTISDEIKSIREAANITHRELPPCVQSSDIDSFFSSEWKNVFRDNDWNPFHPKSLLLGPRKRSKFPPAFSWNIGGQWSVFSRHVTTALRAREASLSSDNSESASVTTSSEPVTAVFNSADQEVFGNSPMEDNLSLVRCTHCKRILKLDSFSLHLLNVHNIKIPDGGNRRKKFIASRKQKSKAGVTRGTRLSLETGAVKPRRVVPPTKLGGYYSAINPVLSSSERVTDERAIQTGIASGGQVVMAGRNTGKYGFIRTIADSSSQTSPWFGPGATVNTKVNPRPLPPTITRNALLESLSVKRPLVGGEQNEAKKQRGTTLREDLLRNSFTARMGGAEVRAMNETMRKQYLSWVVARQGNAQVPKGEGSSSNDNAIAMHHAQISQFLARKTEDHLKKNL